jgi:hypothetical protein
VGVASELLRTVCEVVSSTRLISIAPGAKPLCESADEVP